MTNADRDEGRDAYLAELGLGRTGLGGTRGGSRMRLPFGEDTEARLRELYVAGRIELDEFERRIVEVLLRDDRPDG